MSSSSKGDGMTTRSIQNLNATSSQETHQGVISNWRQWLPRWLIPRKHDKLGGFWKITHVTDTMCMMFINMFVKFIHVPLFTVFPRKPLVVVVELAAFWVCLGSTGIFWFGLLLHNTVRLLSYSTGSIFFPDCQTVLTCWWTRTSSQVLVTPLSLFSRVIAKERANYCYPWELKCRAIYSYILPNTNLPEKSNSASC